MKLKKTFLSVLILGLIPINPILKFTNNTTLSFKDEKSSDINWTEESFPRDFFGDYSYPEFWVLNGTDEVIYENPYSPSYTYYEAHKGRGIITFKEYTGLFNKAVLQGYEPYYLDTYNEGINNNPNGFIALNGEWSVFELMAYIEDWVIWNWNENLDMDSTDSTQTATHDNVNIRISFKNEYAYSIEEVVDDGWSDYPINFSTFRGIGVRDGYSIYFDKEPLFEYEYEEFTNTYFYSGYYLEDRLFLPSEKNDISQISDDEFDEWTKSSFTLEDDFNFFKNEFENQLIIELNDEFISEYGVDELGHDRSQGIYSLEDTRLEDLDITYYELSNKEWIEVVDENKELKEFEQIKIDVKSNEESLVVDTENNLNFITQNSTEVTPPTNDSSLWWMWTIFAVLILTLIVSTLVYILTRKKV